MSSAPAQEGMYGELRAAIGEGFPVPPSLEYIPVERSKLGRGETMTVEYRPFPAFNGLYAEVAAEACARNAAFMPYSQTDKDDNVVIPIRWYPHVTNKKEN